MQPIDITTARRVLEIVDAGIVHGIGRPEPGKMCIEAAVCFALGLPHGDDPPCVGGAVRRVKISLNDARWSSDAARTAGMRRLSVAQLGSNEIDQRQFAKVLARLTIQRVVPRALRAAASVQKEQKHKDALESAAARCAKEGTEESAREGKTAAAYDAYDAYAYAAYAADAAYAAAASAAAAYAAAAAAAAAADAADAAAYKARARKPTYLLAVQLIEKMLDVRE